MQHHGWIWPLSAYKYLPSIQEATTRKDSFPTRSFPKRGATRPPPVAGAGRGASGSGRQDASGEIRLEYFFRTIAPHRGRGIKYAHHFKDLVSVLFFHFTNCTLQFAHLQSLIILLQFHRRFIFLSNIDFGLDAGRRKKIPPLVLLRKPAGVLHQLHFYKVYVKPPILPKITQIEYLTRVLFAPLLRNHFQFIRCYQQNLSIIV